jgi:hypothetical protein
MGSGQRKVDSMNTYARIISQLARVLSGLVLVGLTSCAGASDLRDQLRSSDLHLPFDRRLRFELGAPIIVLGHVLAFTEVGPPQGSRIDPRIKAQLTRIKIDV